MKKIKGCAFGLVIGSILRVFFAFLGILGKAIGAIMVFFGLWIPFIYSLFGGGLYLIYGFNPFGDDLDSMLYLAGFGITLLCSLIITIRNLIIKPSKSVIEGFKTPIWERKKEDSLEEDDKTKPSRKREREEKIVAIKRRHNKAVKATEPAIPDNQIRQKETTHSQAPPQWENIEYEKPKIYYSVRERDTLIHEYSDRFEVFRMIDGRPYLDKVEYKNYGY